MQGNHEAWMNFIRARSCNRNTNETQYVTLRIWEELLKTVDGEEMFRYAGPDCMFGACREGNMCCGKPLKKHERAARSLEISTPRYLIDAMWPLLKEVTI
jgi:thymidylate synthase (FAD)